MVKLHETSRKRKPGPTKPSSPVAQTRADQQAVETILAERARFHRFLASRVGDNATAEDILQDSLLRAIEQNRKLRRGESAVPWFYRILRNAIVDHFRKKGAESRRTEKLMSDLHANGEDVVVPPAAWDAAVCACFRGLLPSLKPRYAEVIRRIDLLGENKNDVGRDLKISRPTMDVLLHRARNALRARLLMFCDACAREKCIECFCAKGKTVEVRSFNRGFSPALRKQLVVERGVRNHGVRDSSVSCQSDSVVRRTQCPGAPSLR